MSANGNRQLAVSPKQPSPAQKQKTDDKWLCALTKTELETIMASSSLMHSGSLMHRPAHLRLPATLLDPSSPDPSRPRPHLSLNSTGMYSCLLTYPPVRPPLIILTHLLHSAGLPERIASAFPDSHTCRHRGGHAQQSMQVVL